MPAPQATTAIINGTLIILPATFNQDVKAGLCAIACTAIDCTREFDVHDACISQASLT